MKLSYKYSRINLAASVAVFIFASIAIYFLLRFIFIKQLDEDLHGELDEITAYVNSNHALPRITASDDEITSYEKKRVPVCATNVSKPYCSPMATNRCVTGKFHFL